MKVIDLDGRVDPTTDPRLEVALVTRIYREMVRARLIDERMNALQRQGRVGFHVGAYGEEASIIASAAALRPQDWLFSCYREIGAAFWRGFELQSYLDNMFGNANDIAEGRQMPDHITARRNHFAAVSSVIGTQIINAVGFSWAAKIRKEDVVTAVYFGDGATSAADFHSGMNFAGVFKTPTVFLLRNNGWAISIPASRQSACRRLVDKALGYGVPALCCDGNDALATYATVQRAVSSAAEGKGPMLVELQTYRLGAHTTSDDPTRYRNESEVERERKYDPIRRLRLYLENLEVWSQQEDEKLIEKIHAELQAAIARAENAPRPAVASIFEKVYRDQPAHLREQQAECERGPRAR
ncbi:MAG: thiamine pyrophosphate-dependent dehydrogenase E1 component subunit alpha [Deltaproteobacteria bacterium]|nr:thiamine pyrophosphate-dependent dehydrogenase E1 component subunit alpha [Deltaproteobacteria bacterium]